MKRLRLQGETHALESGRSKAWNHHEDLFIEGLDRMLNGSVEIVVEPQEKQQMQTTSFNMSEEEESAMRELARKLGVSVDELARAAIHVVLDNSTYVKMKQAKNQVIANDQSGGVGQLNLKGAKNVKITTKNVKI